MTGISFPNSFHSNPRTVAKLRHRFFPPVANPFRASLHIPSHGGGRVFSDIIPLSTRVPGLPSLSRNTAASFVGVYLDGVSIAQTVDNVTPSPVVTHFFSYTSGQVLEFRDEGANAVRRAMNTRISRTVITYEFF
jgi:hypothetical protein